MSDSKILESFVEESKALAGEVLRQLEEVTVETWDECSVAIVEKIKIIKTNSHIMEFSWLGKLCNGFEEILIALRTRNLIYTALVNSFLLELTQVIISHIGDIESGREVNESLLEKWILDCDRIAAGMILESGERRFDAEVESISPQKNYVVSSDRLNEMLESFDDISIQRSRLKQQSRGLEKFDDAAGVEYIRLRKNIESTVKDLEYLLQNVQDQLLEVGMVNIRSTFSEFCDRHSVDTCRIEIEETDLMMDRMIAAPLLRILDLFLSNSMEYGFKDVERQVVHVGARKNGDLIELKFSDNGNGIDFDELRENIISTFPQRKKEILEMDEEGLGMFLFTTGMTSVETGLNEAWKEIEKIKGKLKVSSTVGVGTTFTVNFPKSLSSETGFTIMYGSSKYFIPSHYVLESVSKTSGELVTDSPRPYFEHRNQKIRIYRLSSILSQDMSVRSAAKQDVNTILIIEYLEMKFGLIVDDVVGFSSKSVRPVPCQLKGIQEVEGIVIDENYDIVLVLNMPSLVKRFTWLREYDLKRTEVAARKIVENILVADSSDFARHIIRGIYENMGFFVDEARDGIEALEIIKKKKISLVVAAEEMPRMNGITLMDNIRRNQGEKKIPVILFPFECDDENEKAYVEMGADFVISKNNFDRNKLMDATRNLIGQ